MRYRLRDIPTMLRTPGGRRQVSDGILYRLWPPLSRLARLYRRTVARNTRVVAVVGSFGKSTAARAVAAAIAAPAHRRMTHNAWTSVAMAVLRIGPSQRHAVIEAGISGPGQMERYARMIRPEVTVVTSIGSEHHALMPTLDITRAEKARMVRALPASGVAVLNGDDANVMWMKAHAPGSVVTFGFGPLCDVRATDDRLDWPRGMRFHLSAFGQEREVEIGLIGRQMVYPVLAAIAVALAEGVSLDEALSRCRALAPTPGRMEPVLLPGGAVVLRDDHKATLETIHAALDVLAQIPADRRIVLFGDMSEIQGREWPVYVTIGMRVAAVASRLVLVGRGFRRYWTGARRAGMPRHAVTDGGRTVQEAAAAMQAMLQSGDVVLLKGRRGQKLDRVRLILQGRSVLCDIKLCEVRSMECADCPMLERGWGMHRAITPGWIEPRSIGRSSATPAPRTRPDAAGESRGHARASPTSARISARPQRT
ncbi:UDP-N-acetylmuramoyl-tripeptide--D-alanyl-D-alanine ligase [Burkholderiales bacterium]|nr:UDP-N-acetylmuramoyl-tripeptide--D-alanyl-D-alanine ligase [Burkholderiales bacterium]